MTLTKLLSYQAGYALMGVAYNVISFFVVASGGAPLSTTKPLVGGVSMALYGLALLPGVLGKIGLYRVLMGIAILVYGYGGIVKHLIIYSRTPELYASFSAWALAVGINVFGLVLNLMAVSGRFTMDGSPDRSA